MAERKLWAGLALVGLVFAASGCGDGSPRTESSTTTTTVTVQRFDGTTEPTATTASRPTIAHRRGGSGGPATAGGSTTSANSEPEPQPRIFGLDVPRGGYAVVSVRHSARVELRSEPGGHSVVDEVGRRTEFGSPTVFGVVKQVGRWVGVTTAKLPNGQLAWVRLDPRRLKAGWTKLSIVVDLSGRSAALRDGDHVVRAFPVTIGAPGVDTPTGRFSVTDTFRGDLNPAAYGCCALALSATQPHLPTGWLGGNRIAIHGTTGPLGVAASHGCVRAANADVSALVDKVPLGTPVFIHS